LIPPTPGEIKCTTRWQTALLSFRLPPICHRVLTEEHKEL
jgi:hypothetical protein